MELDEAPTLPTVQDAGDDDATDVYNSFISGDLCLRVSVLPSSLVPIPGKSTADVWGCFRIHPFDATRIVCLFCYPTTGSTANTELLGCYSSKTSVTTLRKHVKRWHEQVLEEHARLHKRPRQSTLDEHVVPKVSLQRKVPFYQFVLFLIRSLP